MKASLSLALLAATSAWAAIASISDAQRVTNVGSIVANRFIVEVATATDIPTKRSLGTPHEQLYRSLRERKISFDVHKEFNSPGLFIGASLTLNNAQDVANLLKTEGVVAVRPVRTFPAPKPVLSRPGVKPGDPGIPDGESVHVETGVDKLHALGIAGKGVKIGILDTGVDYTHPFLGGAFGAGHKIAGGTDLVGDDYDGTNTPVPDPDPLDQCNGHGTHVSGIIGANPGNEFNISGVAYESEIFMYRIFGCAGSVTDDIIVEGLLLGVSEGVDILTMSLGGPDGWTEGTASVVSSRISATGKIVTIAAGNEGSSGSWFTSGPGNGIDAISVAATNNPVIPIQSFDVTGVTHAPILYYDTFPIPVPGTLPLFATSTDVTVVDDACNPLPDDTPDLSGFVVLVRRGTCTFVTKLANVAAKGGNVTLIYDNGNGFAAIDVGNFTAVLIQADDGVFLAETLANGTAVSVTFPQTGGGSSFTDPLGGLIADFTTYGPTNDLFFKPAIAAPGGNILSTFPVPLGSWALLSGTSMATPFLAGSAALLFSVKGKSASVGRTARTLFETTAQFVPSSNTDGDPLQPVSQQGAGLIQVFDALFATTILSKGELLLNDSAHFVGTQTFTVTNEAKTTKTYTLGHTPAGSVATFDEAFAIDGPVPIIDGSLASVKFNQAKFTLGPGQSHAVVATFTPPKADDATLPVYGGFVTVTSGTEVVHATYLGAAGSLKNQPTIDNTDFIFGVTLPAILDSDGNVQDAPVNYTFAGADAPSILWRQNFGTPHFRLDLVSAATTFKPTLSSRGEPFFSFGGKPGGSFSKVPIVGTLLTIDWLGRNDEGQADLDNSVLFTNTFENGTTVPDGSYKILLRALKVTGDPTNEADWESWLSPIIGFNA